LKPRALARGVFIELKKFAASQGASLFGVADISGIKDEFEFIPAVKERVTCAVCFGVGLSGLVLSEVENEPTKLYFHHYRSANMFLDQLAFAVSQWVDRKGFSALPVPASQITDWQKQRAHLSHKKIGFMAGLGWIGRNNLLVSKKFGAQFRLTCVLTDMRLKCDEPVKDDCGKCFACMSACPVEAISETPDDFKHLVCFEKLKDFQRQNVVGQFICGICVKACGKKRKTEDGRRKTENTK
jgi:epoxyqueuosine reductase QueG